MSEDGDPRRLARRSDERERHDVQVVPGHLVPATDHALDRARPVEREGGELFVGHPPLSIAARPPRGDRRAARRPVWLRVAEDNEGVLLRRRYDATTGQQRARVVVDGVRVGTWYSAEASPYVREDEIFVPAQITKGKSSITVRLAPETTFDVESLSAWTVLP